MNDFNDAHVLRQEILGLFDRIQKIRREIASIRKPGDAQDRFTTMSDELDAIVASTESATNSIMENVESIDELIAVVRDHVSDPDAKARLDRVPDHIGAIFEACSFQDITGQRITKVVNTLQYIEKRVNALIEVWGEAALSSVEPRDDKEPLPADDERRLLNGPQLPGRGSSQSDVDAIMGVAGEHPDRERGVDDDAKATSQARTREAGAPVADNAAAPPAKGVRKDANTDTKASKDTKDVKKDVRKDAPSKAPDDSAAQDGGGMDQNDIDKLFG